MVEINQFSRRYLTGFPQGKRLASHHGFDGKMISRYGWQGDVARDGMFGNGVFKSAILKAAILKGAFLKVIILKGAIFKAVIWKTIILKIIILKIRVHGIWACNTTI